MVITRPLLLGKGQVIGNAITVDKCIGFLLNAGTAPLPSYAELFTEDSAPKPSSSQDPCTTQPCQPPLQASDTTQPQIVEV